MGRISMPQGRGSQLHNRRDYEKIGREIPENIDQTKAHENIILVDKEIREAYKEIFGEALEKYNNKQKRADRKIKDYYEHIQKSKNGEKPFYEDVLQWGRKEDFENNSELREKAKNALLEYAQTFEERNPNLKLIGAYLHMDEASPHLHLDFVPIAHGYKTGLDTRNSLDKAMGEMGYKTDSRKNNATKKWKDHERAYFGILCRERGLEVEPERTYGRNQLTPDEYRDLMKDVEAERQAIREKISEQKMELASNSEALDQQAKALEYNALKIKNMDEITSFIGSKDREPVKVEDFIIPEKKSLFGRIEAPERKGIFIEDMQPHQIEALMNRVKIDEGLERVFDEVQERCNQMITQAREEAKEIKAEATAEKNETVAKAESIINQQNSIIERAKAWAKSLERKYKELLDKVSSLLGQKEALEKEVAQIEAYKGEIEPLRAEYEQLSEGVKIMSGELDNQITQAHFKDWNTMPFGANYDSYRQRGELLALYNDGTIRKVGYNEHNGWDNKTLADQSSGKCRVGIMQNEERVSVPKSLVKEMIATRDKSKDISDNLANFIRQQNKVNEIRKDREIHR